MTRRLSCLAAVLLLVLAGGLAAGSSGSSVSADQGTPPSDDLTNVSPHTTFLGLGIAEHLPAGSTVFGLIRSAVDPGPSLTYSDASPAVILIYVESGSITFRVERPIQVTRAGSVVEFLRPDFIGGAVPDVDEIAAGTEFTMEQGDSAIFPAHSAGDYRNDGPEAAVLLLAVLDPSTTRGDSGTPGAQAP